MIDNQGVDVVMRFHDFRRADELERAVFSLVGQEFRPLRILLALQRFSDDDASALEARLAPLLALPDAPSLKLLRFDDPQPEDARSVLVNLGFAAATARYITLLDYDDVLYPEAYRLLSSRLCATDAGIAFAGIQVRIVDLFPDFVHVRGSATPFQGQGLADLFRANFCPIHSFMVDRVRVPPEDLRFEPQMTVEEDYEFLLRVSARVRSDFALIGTQIGEYLYKSDFSNTVGNNTRLSSAMLARIAAARHFNEGRRGLCVLSPAVQQSLGRASHEPNLTIRAFLDSIQP